MKNCSTCKNPMSIESEFCEWCGARVHTDLGAYKFNNDLNIFVTISFEGIWAILDANVKVFVDDDLVGSGSCKNGFHIDFTTPKEQPIIVLKHAFRSQKIDIPRLVKGEKYEVTVSYDRYIKGNFNSTPKKFEKL
jgi:hypothetical protein